MKRPAGEIFHSLAALKAAGLPPVATSEYRADGRRRKVSPDAEYIGWKSCLVEQDEAGKWSWAARIGRPLTGVGKRKPLHTTVAPSTLAAISADIRQGESAGQVIDRWAEQARKGEGKSHGKM